MSFRSVLGTIIIIIAVINLLISMAVLGLTFTACNLGIDIPFGSGSDLSKCGEAYLNFGINFIVSLVWIGIGILIRGRRREVVF